MKSSKTICDLAEAKHKAVIECLEHSSSKLAFCPRLWQHEYLSLALTINVGKGGLLHPPGSLRPLSSRLRRDGWRGMRTAIRWGRFEKYAASILYVSLLGALVLALIGILLFLLVFRPA